MTQTAYAEVFDLSFILTESGYDRSPSWELRVFDMEGVEVYWATHFSIDSAVRAFTRKLSEALAPRS